MVTNSNAQKRGTTLTSLKGGGLKSLMLAVASVFILTGTRVEAQACKPDSVGNENPATGNLRIRTASCYGDTAFVAHFASAKGAYANAMVFDSPNTSSACPTLNSGASSCLFYTGECGSGGSSTCPQDPNAEPGELSCFCSDPSVLAPYSVFPLVSPGSTVEFATRLLVDTDADGKNESEWYSKWTSNPSSTDQVRSYALHNDLYRWDWEDAYTGGDGDFNDYIALLEARTCGKLPYPIASLSPEASLSCAQDCPQSSGCRPETIDNSSMKFHIAIGADNDLYEARETRGRTLHVTVTTYAAEVEKGRRFAVCPRLWIAPEGNNIVADDIQRVFYGAEPAAYCSGAWNDDVSG